MSDFFTIEDDQLSPLIAELGVAELHPSCRFYRDVQGVETVAINFHVSSIAKVDRRVILQARSAEAVTGEIKKKLREALKNAAERFRASAELIDRALDGSKS